MELIGVPEAARQLGVSAERVRQLIRHDELLARRVGGRWLVDQESLARRAQSVRRAGRPFAPARSWGLLALASGRDPTWLSEADRRDLAAVLARRGVEGVHHQLAHRADVKQWYVHPSMIEDLLGEDGVVLSGARASGVLRSKGPVELYVSPAVINGLVQRYRPDQRPQEPNLIVREVRGPWPFAPGERRAWRPLVAVDLLDRPDDARAVRAAHELLGRADA